MGDHRLRGNRARRTIKPISQDTTGKSVWRDSSKSFLKHKKEPLRLPTSVEGQHRLSGKEWPDDFRKVGMPSAELTPGSSTESTVFPTISRGMPSPVANQTPRTHVDISGLYPPLLRVQQTRRTFWDDIGFRQNQNLLSPWPRGEETSADILIKMLETPNPEWLRAYRYPFGEGYREASKQPTNTWKQSQGKLDLEPHKLPWSCQGTWHHDGKPRGQDMLSSLYYKYIYKGGEGALEWDEYYERAIKQFNTGYENQPNYEESSVKKTDPPTLDLKYGKKTTKGKGIKLSKRNSNFNTKLPRQHDPHKASKEIRYESSSCLKNHRLKTLENEDPVIDSNEPELQGENIGNAEVVREPYEPTDWRYYISKEETTPSTLELMFMKRRWGLECSSPTSNMFKDCYWVKDTGDDDDDDDDDEHK